MVLCFDSCGKLCPAGCIRYSCALCGVLCHSHETEERTRKRILKGEDISWLIAVFLWLQNRVLGLIVVSEQGRKAIVGLSGVLLLNVK